MQEEACQKKPQKCASHEAVDLEVDIVDTTDRYSDGHAGKSVYYVLVVTGY